MVFRETFGENEMITEQQLDEMIEQQMKIPLLHRAMGVDLPDSPIDMECMKERFPFAFMETKELVKLLSEQMK